MNAVEEGDGHCKLWDDRGINSTESFKLQSEGSNVFSLTFEDRTWFCSQFAGRGDGCQGFVYGLNFDFSSMAESSRRHPYSISYEDDRFVECAFAVEKGIGFTVCTVGAPVTPVFFPILGSLVSDAIGNVPPRKQEVTRQENFGGIVRSVQDVFCGNGK